MSIIEGIPKTWSYINFDEIQLVPIRKKVKQSAYIAEGALPVVDQGQDLVGGYTNDVSMRVECELPVIVFGDHTKVVKYIDFDFAAGADGIKILKPTGIFDSKFFYYQLLGSRLADRGYSRHFQYLRKLPLKVAPLAEQERIKARIEELFSPLDNGLAELNSAVAMLKQYRASLLASACAGKLVPTEAELVRAEGRSYEGGADLLARILKERREKWNGRGKYKEPKAPDTAGLPPLPEGWIWASVDQLFLNVTDGDHLPPPQTREGVPFLVIGNVRSGEVDFSNTRFVSKNYARSLDLFRKPRFGDILYTLVGSFGLAVKVDTEKDFCVQRHMAILRPHDLSPTRYLLHALNSELVFRQASSVATGTAQLTVPLAGLRSIAIPLPPAAEHERIVAELDRRLSVIAEMEEMLSRNLRRADRLRQSILQQAFAGKLVPQDETEEPAAELLARIIFGRVDAAPRKKMPSKRFGRREKVIISK